MCNAEVYEASERWKDPTLERTPESLQCSALGCEGCSMSLPFFYSIWLVPFALTLLAWRAGLRAIAIAGVSKSSAQARTWPAMVFLAGPVAVEIIYISLRVGHVDQLTAINTFVWIGAIGAMSSVAAWSPRRGHRVAFVHRHSAQRRGRRHASRWSFI